MGIAQLVRALVCGTRGRGFKSHYPPKVKGLAQARPYFVEQDVASLLAKVFAKAKKKTSKKSFDFEGSTDNTGIMSEASNPCSVYWGFSLSIFFSLG